ncbi:MAG: M28 family peptidase [Bacteroidales bacterium]|nr:M28 family peptidase [Bacteroidales bacterium]
MRKSFILLSAIAGLTMVGCNSVSDYKQAEDTINYNDLERYIDDLSDDLYGGRKPFSPEEKLTVDYIAAEFKRIGLEPANNGSYFQEVPMVQVNAKVSDKMVVNLGKESIELVKADEFTAFSRRLVKDNGVENNELVFAGFGVVAPEYNWNDYQNIDVKGKTVVVLVNDPGFYTKKEGFFNGSAMTYYGRWKYKFEEAARQGAAGCIIIHATDAAGYPWGVVRNGLFVPKLYLNSPTNYMERCQLESWWTGDAANKVFAKLGYTVDQLIDMSLKPDFKPFDMNAKVSVSIENSMSQNSSKNVMALLPGTDKADECIIYTGHWDHLGRGPKINGDSIYNGASDNAAAVAWVLEIAEAFKSLKKAPSRSVLFISVTAEEGGLMGSEYYCQNPIFPVEKTVAAFNTDVILFLGKFKDVTVTGFGQSELDDCLAEVAKDHNRYVMADQEPENGMYYRSDHFSFAKVGIPALFAKGYNHVDGQTKEWTKEKISEYWKNTYHKPSDEYVPERDNLDGLVEDSKLMFDLGYRLANSNQFPKWKTGSEFKAIREKK